MVRNQVLVMKNVNEKFAFLTFFIYLCKKNKIMENNGSSMDMLVYLCNKKNRTEEEEKMISSLFREVYPNEFDDDFD